MNTAALKNKYLPLLFRFILAAVFLFAGIPKIINPEQFAVSISNYRVLQHEYINLVAITLPWIEVVAGLLLIVGIWVRASALLVTALMAMFIVLIASAVARGLNIECGCFGTAGGQRVGLTKIIENTLLLAMSAWLTWTVRDRKAVSDTTPAQAAPEPVA